MTSPRINAPRQEAEDTPRSPYFPPGRQPPLLVEVEPDKPGFDRDQVCGLALVFLIYLILQSPFTVCNLYFAYSEPESVCMDEGENGLVVRNWFRGVGITEVVIAAGFLLGLLSLPFRSVGLSGGLLLAFLVIAVVKQLVWAVASIFLYQRTIREQCEGSVHAYGLSIAIVHAIYLGLFGFEAFRRS